MSKLAKALTAAAGNAGGESLYVEDVFSTYLLQSTSLGVSETVSNGVNLLDEGGLVWSKARDGAGSHILVDTERGASDCLFSDGTGAEVNIDTITTAFYTDGFESGSWINSGGTAQDYASWTFRKAEKFFDVVTYTGNGGVQNISHNLGAVPAVIIVKNTQSSYDWGVYTASTGNGSLLLLNSTSAAISPANQWNNTTPTDSVFTVGNTNTSNRSGQTYVAYLFASDAGGFGDDGSENIIKCGSYTGNGTNSNYIDFGFEPQWLLVKNATNGSTPWLMIDNMRGWPAAPASAQQELIANGSNAESTGSNVGITSTGIGITTSATPINASGSTYIYIAIRRPMKTPESGTEVFAVDNRGGTLPALQSSFPVDAAIIADTSGAWANSPSMGSRLTGTGRLSTSNTNAEASDSFNAWDYMDGWGNDSGTYTQYYSWMFKRATGFFDVVAYTGTGSTAAYQSNLGVPVEFVIVKRRDSAGDWYCWHTSFGQSLVPNIKLNSNAAKSSATLAVWLANPNLANYFWVTGVGNTSGADYISYHFATLAGVSKVGSYTGTGSNVDVDCGFSAGARFVLIKRTDSTGDWYVWDSVRGIVAGNDPYLLLNSTAAENTSTDYIDPLSSGFTVTSSAPAALNASGGSFVYLAIA